MATNKQPSSTAKDWWNASWIADVNARPAEPPAARKAALESHAAALAVLEDHAATGRPFALFLHVFRIVQTYGHFGLGVMSLDVHLNHALLKVGGRLIKVQAPELETSVKVPGLLLENATWLPAVKALMTRAEMIVIECQSPNPGVLAELQALADLQKTDRTVLILPSPAWEESSPPLTFDENLVWTFVRAIYQRDLNFDHPVEAFIFRDLIQRIGRIARIAPAKRRELIDSGGLDKAEAVSFRGVPQGFENLAVRYSRDKIAGAAYFSGWRGVKAAALAFGLARSLQLQLRLADRYGEADCRLAITEYDEIEKELATANASIDPGLSKRLLAASRRGRIKWLATYFEQLQSKGENAELWQLAQSQAAYAIDRHDTRAMAQCFSWMAVGALGLGRYEQAREHAEDAVMFARKSKDRFREGFASVYLGHAQRKLAQNAAALESYLTAVRRLPQRQFGRIHVVAMLSAAEMAEVLMRVAAAKPLFESARTMALGMNQPDLLTAAEAGLARLASRPND